MGTAISMMNYVLGNLRGKERVIRAESLMNYAAVVGNLGGNLMGKAVEKSKELPAVVGNLGGYLMGKTVEKSKDLPSLVGNLGGYLVGEAVLLILLHYFPGLGGSAAAAAGKLVVKMMKAPGRNYMMPRDVFESNPRAYFRDLRGK